MNKIIIILQLVFVTAPFTVYGQQKFDGKIANHSGDKPPMDIVLFMFGMDHTLKVGHVDKAGNISIEFPDQLPNTIKQETKNMFSTQLPHALFFSCYELNSIADSIANTTVYKGGYFSLAHENQPWAGTLFTVADSGLIPWLEDRYYKTPTITSFYEIIYCDKAINLKTSCKETIQYEANEITAHYNYDLELTKGFNIIEYKIEALKESGIEDIPPIPSLVNIKNTKDTTAIQWHAKYYYSDY